jgi:hypothetical protein
MCGLHVCLVSFILLFQRWVINGKIFLFITYVNWGSSVSDGYSVSGRIRKFSLCLQLLLVLTEVLCEATPPPPHVHGMVPKHKDDTEICSALKIQQSSSLGVFLNKFIIKNANFWDVTPCGSCKNQHFGGTYCLHHHDDKNRQARNNVSSN